MDITMMGRVLCVLLSMFLQLLPLTADTGSPAAAPPEQQAPLEPPLAELPSAQRRQYLVSLGAIYRVASYVTLEGHDELYDSFMRKTWGEEASVRANIQGLQSDWGITDHDSALEKIAWALEGGHREAYDALYLAIRAGTQEEWAAGDAVRTSRAQRAVENLDALEPLLMFGFDCTRQELDAIPTIAAWDYMRAANLVQLCYNADYLTEEECWEALEQVANLVTADFGSWREYYLSFILGRAVVWSESDQTRYIVAGNKLLNDPSSAWVRYPIDLAE